MVRDCCDKLSQMNKRLIVAAWMLVLAVFLFTRLFHLSERYFFFNDMGRDYLVLWDWKTTGKPPLLGPQNSVLPFNQSAIFFYWLMPVYLLTGGSYFSSVYTVLLTYIGVIGWLGWQLRKDSRWQYILLTFSWLVAIHPATIEQNIFVWNPSFITPFLMAVLVSWWQHYHTQRRSWLIALGLFTGLSIGFSYSIVPVFFALTLIVIAVERRRSWLPLLSMAVGTALMQLPTLVFEVRHDFLLTNAVFRWINAGAPDTGSALPQSIGEKFSQLLFYTLGVSDFALQVLILGLLLIGIGWAILTIYRRQFKPREQEKLLILLIVILAITIVITLLLPTPIHSHYIFGFVTLLFFIIATLPKWNKLSIVVLLTLIWLAPSRFLTQLTPAPRTIAESVSCARQVCTQETEPVFVSVQSDLHPFHSAPDWRYLFLSNGCQVKKLETEPQSASKMLVVEEFSKYTHGSTAFHELTLFGKSDLIRTHKCSENNTVYVLERSTTQ